MDRLPAELVLFILHSVSDFAGLYSLIRASHYMHEVYQLSRSSILASLLQSSLPRELLREAYAVEASSILTSRHLPYVKHIMWLGKLLSDSGYPLPETNLFNRVTRLHFAVEWLTNDLCEEFTRSQKSLNFTALPLLPEEKVRIYRAFYRLQLLCDNFRMENIMMDWADIRKEFLDLQSLWEVEEVVSVYEYLVQKLASTFEVCWDLRFINGSQKPFSTKDLLISQGLIFLHRIFAKTDNFDREPISAGRQLTERRRARIICHSSLPTYLTQRDHDHRLLPGLASAYEDAMVKTLPNAGWLLKHYGHSGIGIFEVGSVWSSSRWSWGYCLWSSVRLSSTGLFDKLLAFARERGWDQNPSKYLVAMGGSMSEEWASIVDEIVLSKT